MSATIEVVVTPPVEVGVNAPAVVSVEVGDKAGPRGPAGPGVPAGGTTSQVLGKASGADYDTEWVDQSGGTGGGAVDSVNGQTGVVVLSASDVGADTAAARDTAIGVETSRAEGVEASKANTADLAPVATSGAYTDLTGAPTLGTAAGAATTDFDAAGAATAAQTAAEAYTDSGLAGKQPLDADLTTIAALTPTDGQHLAWSSTLGAWTVVNPTGAARLAEAINTSNTPQTVAAAAVVDITGCAISVTNSGGRGVDLVASYVASQTSATAPGAGSANIIVYETTSGSPVLLASSNAPAYASGKLVAPLMQVPIGVVTTTRTFKLTASSGGTMAFTVQNSPTQLSRLTAFAA